MKLNHVLVNNYRGKNFDFTPGLINIFLGKNGQGKTSLCDAIRFGITGQAPKDDVRNMTVTIDFDAGFSATRSKSKAVVCRINDKKVTEKALNEAIVDAIGVPLDSVKISSSSDVVLNMKPNEFLKLLVQYIPEKLDFDTVSQYFVLPTPKAIEAARELFPEDGFGIDDIGRAYEKAFDKRKDLNSQIRVKSAEIYALNGVTPPERDLREIEADMAELSVIEHEFASYADKFKAYEVAANKKKKQDETIQELRKRMDSLNPESPGEAPENVEEGAEEAYAKRKEEIYKIIADKEAEIRLAENNIGLFKRTLENLNAQHCPLSDKLVCTTDKSVIRSEIEEALAANTDAMEKAKANVKALEEERKSCDEKTAEIVKKRKVYQAYEQYKAQLDFQISNPVPVPEKPASKLNAEEIRARRAKLNQEKKNVDGFKRKNLLVKELNDLKGQAEVYNYIVSSLSDKGNVKSSIISYYLSMFEEVCNSRAYEFAKGYSVKFVPNDGVVVLVKTPGNKDYYPLDSLSRGETIIASFILMDMLNQLSNSRLLFLDNVEALDEESLVALRDLVESEDFMDAYDHVFICGVNHDSVARVFDDMIASWI